MRTKLSRLMKIILEEKRKAEKVSVKTKQAAIEIAKTANLSPSAAGDRWHSAGQAWMTEERLNRLERLYSELSKFVNLSPNEKVKAPSYIKVNFGGEVKELFLVENPIFLDQYQLISDGSPIRSLLLDKKKGEKIKTKTSTGPSLIEILEIE